ncbi:MAG: sigma-54 dependent transcriptional regulator [Acidobacteriota bacterium]|nr:sigma-54 dependent transcriptional regulator [Acidobacteriota bacterium]MDH3784926.1 sigma-54 dependent transcriptional regulator [Acidobacteriota bacterium]
MSDPENRILVIDDEPGVRDSLEAVLRDEGFHVDTVGSGEAGLEQLEAEDYAAIFLDVWLPGKDGLETLTELRHSGHDAEVLMISGHGTIDTAVRATKLGAFDFVEKPLSLEKTLLVLRNALRQRRLRRVNVKLLAQLSRDTAIVGKSAAARGLRSDVGAAAESDSAVWIMGEPGTGRETVARRIHGLGQDAAGPFVDVRCGALASEPARIALFDMGGAGRIRLAYGGTLMLTDVDRLDADDQRRLADVLREEQTTRRLRVLTIMRHDAAEIDTALHKQLAVIRIDVPPLRKRREDIPEFAERFIVELAEEYGAAPIRWTNDSLAALQRHDWPGNVAELRNLVEHCVMSHGGPTIESSDLPAELGGRGRPVVDLYGDFESLANAVEEFRRFHAGRALEREQGDRSQAAERLGVSEEELERLVAGD